MTASGSDTIILALSKILDEWTSIGAFAARVANVKNETGLASGNRLNESDGATQTVFNDNDVDRLTGNSDRDAFWANVLNNNGGPLDLLLDFSSLELAIDTDY